MPLSYNDGVTDDLDQCPDTPSGEAVDSVGCSEVISLVDYFRNTEKLSIYPNPVENQFQINTKSTHVIIFDVIGKKVAEYKGNFESHETFSVAHLKNGLYIVKVKNEHGSAVQKIIKKYSIQ
jgi:hypothetical protein